MERDAKKMRGERPFIFTDLKAGIGVDEVAQWVKRQLAAPRRPLHEAASYVRPAKSHTHAH
jgi:hypothetical protein